VSDLKQTCDLLKTEWKRLDNQWQITADQWHDAIRQRFEREFFQEYERTLPPVLNQMDRLAEVIAKALREVK